MEEEQLGQTAGVGEAAGAIVLLEVDVGMIL